MAHSRTQMVPHQQGDVRSVSLSSPVGRDKPVDTEEVDLNPQASDSKGKQGREGQKQAPGQPLADRCQVSS